MMRVAETDDELALFARIRLAASPRETRQPPRREPDRLLLLWDDVGCGLAARSDLLDSVTVRVFVRPEARGRGIGTALADRLVEHARTFARRDSLFTTVDTLQPRGVAFAERRGLVEVDYEVELRRPLGDLPAHEPGPLPGIEVVSVAERPELLEPAYHCVAVEGYLDLPTPSPVEVTLEQWLDEEATLPEGSFVALDGREVVGYAGLLEGGEHGLTAVRRTHRRRGIASALKARQLAWASAAGLPELVTWTQGRNSPMQRVNELLGYRPEPPWLKLKGPLP